jgi:hypothetical protein
MKKNTPELDKMHAVHPQSQAVGEFIEWLQSEKGVWFGKPHKHDASCPGWDHERKRYNPGLGDGCSYQTDEFEPFHFSMEKLLAEFFEIDLSKAEAERRVLLEGMRNR